MAVQPYENCPCGSGKKHKWCCAPYFERVQQAFEAQQQGQHDNARRMFQSIVAEFPDRPQVWGFYANLLFGEDLPDQAEHALAKAFELDPHFPMGYLLQGVLRQQEGEVIGALMLFRRAAEAYPVEAADQLAQVNEMIARNEVVLNRPVAARAALERAVHFAPQDEELRTQFQGIFGDDSRLPAAARKKYSFRPTVKPVAAEPTGKLSDARAAFETLTHEVPDDPAAWFNLGLARAWLGEQPGAVAALQQSLDKEWDDARAEEAGALIEVLRCAQGMEADTDYLEHRVFFPVRDPETVFQLIQVMANERRVLAPQMDPEGQFFSCLIVEELPTLIETGTAMARARANLTIAGGVMRLWHVDAESVRKVATEIRDRVNLAVGEPSEGSGVAQFQDILQEAMAYPVRSADPSSVEGKLRDRATQYFEETWSRRPLKALSGVAPIDAAGSSLLRKRLLGVVRFLADCMASNAPRRRTATGEAVPVTIYDFDRLRHRLSAEVRPAGDAPDIRVPVARPAVAPQAPVAAQVSAPKPVDFSALSLGELGAVDAGTLGVGQCEEAMRAALKLDARELAVHFAGAGVTKPADAAHPDRYPLFACAITGAASEGNFGAAIGLATHGLEDDAAHNGGKRAAEFTLQRARLLARSGQLDAATGEFDTLLERFGDEPRFYIAATESMLSAKQGGKALAFAEKGLAAAKRLNSRDLDGACRELAEAARKMVG